IACSKSPRSSAACPSFSRSAVGAEVCPLIAPSKYANARSSERQYLTRPLGFTAFSSSPLPQWLCETSGRRAQWDVAARHARYIARAARHREHRLGRGKPKTHHLDMQLLFEQSVAGSRADRLDSNKVGGTSHPYCHITGAARIPNHG